MTFRIPLTWNHYFRFQARSLIWARSIARPFHRPKSLVICEGSFVVPLLSIVMVISGISRRKRTSASALRVSSVSIVIFDIHHTFSWKRYSKDNPGCVGCQYLLLLLFYKNILLLSEKSRCFLMGSDCISVICICP